MMALQNPSLPPPHHPSPLPQTIWPCSTSMIICECPKGTNVGNCWRENCDQCQKNAFSILSRPVTMVLDRQKKWSASKILRLLSLFFEKKVSSCSSSHEYVAFTRFFRRFWMRYSETIKSCFQNFFVVPNIPTQMQTFYVVS